MERPQMRMSGPVLDAPDVPTLTEFYEALLGWKVDELEGPRAGEPPQAGWSVLHPDEGGGKIEIQWEEHYARPVWPGAPGQPGMQLHLDFWVEDVEKGVAWAVACGAAEADSQPAGRDLSRLRVMIDPAGHPFCLWS